MTESILWLYITCDDKDFIIKTDQPEFDGGSNTAPTPFDLFLASLGTCAGFYVLLFCEKRNISTKELKIKLLTESNKESGMIKKIKLEIHLPSTFPEKYKEAIIKSAETCSVARHMYNPPILDIETILVRE